MHAPIRVDRCDEAGIPPHMCMVDGVRQAGLHESVLAAMAARHRYATFPCRMSKAHLCGQLLVHMSKCKSIHISVYMSLHIFIQFMYMSINVPILMSITTSCASTGHD